MALALGANVGDRFRNIELALRYLENPEPILIEVRKNLDNMEGDLRVVETSFLYETAPMYVVDQPSFINCACLVSAYKPNRYLSYSQCAQHSWKRRFQP